MAQPIENPRGGRLSAAGGLVGAILASSCCIAPLALVSLGVGGAWLGHLTALAPFQWLFVTASVGFLGAGFWFVYFKDDAGCEQGGYCARPASGAVVKIALWCATVLVVAAVGVNVLAPFII